MPNAKPIHQNPYPVSFKRKGLFQRELNNMIADNIFTQIGESEWGFPCFIISKKDGRVWWLSDFRKLNKLIVRKPFRFQRYKIYSSKEVLTLTSPKLTCRWCLLLWTIRLEQMHLCHLHWGEQLLLQQTTNGSQDLSRCCPALHEWHA